MPSAMPFFPYQRQRDDRSMVHQQANAKQAHAAGQLPHEVRNMISPLLPPIRRPRVRARIIGFLWSWLLRLQYATWRVDVEGLDRLDQRKPIICARLGHRSQFYGTATANKGRLLHSAGILHSHNREQRFGSVWASHRKAADNEEYRCKPLGMRPPTH